MIAACMAFGTAWCLGVLGVAAFWPAGRLRAGDAILIASLGLGLGLGATSVVLFGVSLLTDASTWIWIIELLLIAGAAGIVWWRRSEFTASREPHPARAGWLDVVIGFVFTQACVASLVVAVRAYGAEPFSSSDGWTTWNMHARIVHHGGQEWPQLLRAPQLDWTHRDYPLLLPLSVARGWRLGGHDDPFVAGAISTLFAVATVGVLVGAVMRLRQRTLALAGGLVLLGTPFFVTFASNQHADIPLGFYILASLVLLAARVDARHEWRLAALAGAAAGLAAWTKNEGILFALVAGSAWLGRGLVVRRERLAVAAFFAGLALTLVPLLYFKFALAPANDIVASDPWTRWQALWDGSRHRLILSAMLRDLGRFGEWSVPPFLAMLLPLVGRGWRRINGREWMVAAMLALVFAGYYVVYLLTHMDLAFHLDSSLVRLLLQLWPGAVFFWCLAVPAGPAGAPLAEEVRSKRAMLLPVVLNAAGAAGLLIGLGRQLPANQLSAARIDGAGAGVFVGEGWFPPEKHGRDVWCWSKGESTLRVRLESADAAPVTLRFDVRALGARGVTARINERTIWQAELGDEAKTVEIRETLPGGATDIVFQTDAPGVLESDHPLARRLAYAIYNPRLE